MSTTAIARPHESGAAAPIRAAAAPLLLSAVMLGGAYATSFVAGRAGLPVSRSLVYEGRWLVGSWRQFPLVDCSGMLFFMVAAPILWERLGRVPLRSVGLRLTPVSVVLSAAAVAPAGVMWYVRHGLARAFGSGLENGEPMLLILYFLIVAVAEETAFRGIIQRRLAGLCGTYASIAIASAVFVLWHGVPADATELAVRFGAGVILGAAYRLTGSLLVPVVLHWAFNVVVCAA